MEITYLLGAGASANALPITESIPKNLNNYKSEIAKYKAKLIDLNLTEGEIEFYTKGIEQLVEKCDDHASIDTYAKKLFHLEDHLKLDSLKTLISDLLTYETKVNGVDKRYDAFFAAILEGCGKELSLPPNINILSWNYDTQIQYSLNQFQNASEDSDYIDILSNTFPRHAEQKVFTTSKFCVVKLNGSIGGFMYKKGGESVYQSELHDLSEIRNEFIENNKLKLIHDNIERYWTRASNIKNRSSNPEWGLLFAWERNKLNKEIRDKALEIMNSTDVLVVIGYSFPTFNRSYDRQLLLTAKRKLKKIYVQTKESTIEDVTQRLTSLLKIPDSKAIVKLTGTNEFIIPFEFG